MIERVFEYVFVLAVFAPPTAVVIGVVLLFAGPRHRHGAAHAPRTVVA